MENYNNQQNNNPYNYNSQQPPYYNQGYQGYPHPQQQPFYPPQPPQPPVKKKNRGFGVFAVILAVFLVIGIVANTVILLKNSSSRSDSSAGSSQNSDTDFDSLNDNALKPGVDSGSNDLVVKIHKEKGKKLSTTQIADKCKNCVIGITTYTKNGILHDEASGIVIGTDSKKTKSYILTCAHVVADDEEEGELVHRIMDASAAEYTAAVIGYDKSCDVAVLSVEKVGFNVAVLGDSTAVKSGETVIAVGNPGGSEFYGSVTKGIVSATDRMVTTSMSSMACIQHDAAINPGSSGGALLNEYGQVIGINYSKMAENSYEGMSFAIPSATAVKKANQIIKTSLKTSGAKIGIEYYVSASYFDDKYTIIKKIGALSVGDEIKLTIAQKNSKGDYDTKDVSVKLIEK